MSLSKRHYSDSPIRSNLHVIDTPPTDTEVGLTRKQLALEVKLQQNSHDLLQLYQESQNWIAVSEIAQSLNTNSKRIEQLKKQLLSLENPSLVSQPPLLESISEAETPANNTNDLKQETNHDLAHSPVESTPTKEDVQEDHTQEESEETQQEENKESSEESSCSKVREEGGEEIISPANHSLDSSSTPEKPLNYKEEELPITLEGGEEGNNQNTPLSPEKALEEGTSSKEESKLVEVPTTEGDISQPQQPPQLVSEEPQEQADTPADAAGETLKASPVSDNPPREVKDQQDGPSFIDSSSEHTVNKADSEKLPVSEKDLVKPTTDIQLKEPSVENRKVKEPTSQASAPVDIAKESFEEPIGGATFEESLDQLASFVDQLQLDLNLAEESLPEVTEQLETIEQNAVEEKSPTPQEVEPEPIKDDSTSAQKESSPQPEDTAGDKEAQSESSDDTSDQFFSLPESLEPSPTHSNSSSLPPEENGVQDQPQIENIATDTAAEHENPESDRYQESQEPLPLIHPSDQLPDNSESVEQPVQESTLTEKEEPITVSTQEDIKPSDITGINPSDTVPPDQITDSTEKEVTPEITSEKLEDPLTTVTEPAPTSEEVAPEEISSNQAEDSSIDSTEPAPTSEEVAPEEISSNQAEDSSIDSTEPPPTSAPLTVEEIAPEISSNQVSANLEEPSTVVTEPPPTSVPVIAEEEAPEETSNQPPAELDNPSSISTLPPSTATEEQKLSAESSAADKEEDKVSDHEMSDDNNKITFTVNKIASPSNGSVFYRVDVRSYEVLFADPELLQHLPVLHSLEDFLKLRECLLPSSTAKATDESIPQLISQHDESDTSVKNGKGIDAEGEKLEQFLNHVVSDPELRKNQAFIDFLSGKEPTPSSSPTQDTNTSEDMSETVNGDTSEPPLGSQPEKDAPLTTTTETINSSNTASTQDCNDGDNPPIKTDDENTQSPPQSEHDELLTLSPNHTERTSSSATNSSNIASEESAPELGEKEISTTGKIGRSESNPVLADYGKPLHDTDTLHQSLMPSNYKYPSSDNIVESGITDIGEEGIAGKSRQSAKRSTMRDKIKKKIRRSMSTKGKQRSQTLRHPANGDIESSVSINRPLTSQEWDPTCLLEELYSDYKQGATANDISGESARHYGYLEKLPTGQSKASVLKGWKRRYFRAQEGNIYYYEGRTQERALGFIRLSTARIVVIPEKNQIQIVEKTGKNSIMLKAPDKDELQAWHRALELEAVHPTQPAPASPLFRVENPILIVDIGACSVRAGFSREDAYPEVFFPAVCSLDASSLEILDCGHNALLPQNRYGAHQVYPRKTSSRMDKHDTNLKIKAIDGIVCTILEKLDVNPQSTQVLFTHPPTLPEKDRNDLAELLLGSFEFNGVCFQEQALLALYSYNTTSGIVVDIGDHIDVVPFIDGYKIEAGVSRMLFGGNAITENLSKLITAKGIRYFSETEVYINRLVKESLCYVSQNFEDDSAKCEANPAGYTRAVDVDRFRLPDHRKVIALDGALFKAPEGLFKPNLWGKDVPAIQDLVWKAIQQCPIDQRREMAKKIFLSGATTLIPGLQERLQKEVTALSPGGLVIEVHSSPTRQHAAYLGASVLAGLSSFQSCLVTQEEWNLEGIDTLKKWSTT